MTADMAETFVLGLAGQVADPRGISPAAVAGSRKLDTHILRKPPVTTPDNISFTCNNCSHTASFPSNQEGKAIYCPKCQAAQVVRATARIEIERIPTGTISRAESGPKTDRIAKPNAPSRIDFTCESCQHTSRIASALSGQPVRCPTCGMVQLAGVTGMRTARLDTGGKLPFVCSACNYQARLNPDYAGKAIRCPKCQGAQVVPRVVRDPETAATQAPVVERLAIPRTPLAGSLTVGSPPMPTPLPGVFATPPPGLFTTPLPQALAPPTPTPVPIASTPAPAPVPAPTPALA
ncbi:MAG: hypothetical protein AAB263_09470, partial [Planctomycetota bacterium]